MDKDGETGSGNLADSSGQVRRWPLMDWRLSSDYKVRRLEDRLIEVVKVGLKQQNRERGSRERA